MLSIPATLPRTTPRSSSLVRPTSCPQIVADGFERTTARQACPPALRELMRRAEAQVRSAQRAIDEEDRARARLAPVAGGKKLGDYGSLGMSALYRHGQRHRVAGQPVREVLSFLGIMAAEAVGLATLGGANLLALGGRYAYEKVGGSPYLKARSDGGVREDMLLRDLQSWRAELGGTRAARLLQSAVREGGAESAFLLQAAASVTRAEDQIVRYIDAHEDAQVRCSLPLRGALQKLHPATDSFVKALVQAAV